jgi:hypothetical protein
MSTEDRSLAEDCWKALSILRHPSCLNAETPEWLATAAAYLGPQELPS